MTLKNNDTLKKMDKHCKEWSELALGAAILTWTWFPKACMKAYAEWKKEKYSNDEETKND